ncbi:MAG: RCC1 domain-containing protein [Ilumatobacteraceae bacterium]
MRPATSSRVITLVATVAALVAVVGPPAANAGKPVKDVTWSDEPVDFGTLETFAEATKVLRLTNTGTKTLRKPEVVISRSSSSDINISSNGCTGVVLKPGQWCELTVRFLPTAASARTATITATAARESWSVGVIGNGVAMEAPTALVAGYLYSCAVLTGGGAACWGSNISGNLGNGTTNDAEVRRRVSGLTSGVTSIDTGIDHACAVVSGGVKCWGGNTYGQVGNGTTSQALTPVDVSGLSSGVASIAIGYVHSCALTTAGGVKCWGGNGESQLGNGVAGDSSTPVDVDGLSSGVASIAAYGNHTCALSTGGGVKCWGAGYFGQLGNGGLSNSNVPVDVSGLSSGVASISAGDYFSCAVTTAGAAVCWGNNFSSRLGNPGAGFSQTTPVPVLQLTSGVASVASGDGFSCALTTSGGAKCWGGGGLGQLGDGTETSERATVADVTGLTSGVSALSVGGAHACAVLTSGAFQCWGFNGYGQVGDGTFTNRSTPTSLIW